ncbi:MAG: hypothetical protein DCF30_21060 [Hyphomicrobiales bacterium]|nr:MAG: hypothetical protein DCF30_21060 [Hyphomicrobiales bacterium]
MQITLKRTVLTQASTVGKLSIDGRFVCYTIEDRVRPQKIDANTAIPAGTYDVIINESPRFKRKMPRLMDVPDFTGILIHWGNKAGDTEGCILVGNTVSRNFIGNSRATFNKIFKRIDDALAGGPVTITIA